MEKKAGKPNLQKLLLPTKHHPDGRISIDPETGMPRNPQNNVLYIKEQIIRHESGAEIGKLEIPVNGGHAHEKGSVWRTGLQGPKKYHQKVLQDDETYRLKGKMDRVAPELEIEEAKEYTLYLEFLKETGKADAPRDQLPSDADFYAWLKKEKAEIVVQDDDVIVKKKAASKKKES